MLGVVFRQGQTGLLYIIQTQANYHKPLPAVKSNMLHEEYRDCQCCILPPPDSLDTIWQHTPDLEACWVSKHSHIETDALTDNSMIHTSEHTQTQTCR